MNEQRQLIEKFVKANPKYSGNEDLFDDFCSEAFQKSYMIFNSDSSVQKIESYVSKVVNTSIVEVLKNNGRVTRTAKGYVSVKEVPLTRVVKPAVKDQISNEKYTVDFDFPDPRENVEELIVKKDLLQRIADVVCTLHTDKPQKCYLDIFYLRYMKHYKQSQISEKLNLSQAEVSKRLLELSKLIKAYLSS